MNFFHVSYSIFRGWHHYPLSSQNPHLSRQKVLQIPPSTPDPKDSSHSTPIRITSWRWRWNKKSRSTSEWAPQKKQLHPRSLTVRPWKWMVGILFSFWVPVTFSWGELLNFRWVFHPGYPCIIFGHLQRVITPFIPTRGPPCRTGFVSLGCNLNQNLKIINRFELRNKIPKQRSRLSKKKQK